MTPVVAWAHLEMQRTSFAGVPDESLGNLVVEG